MFSQLHFPVLIAFLILAVRGSYFTRLWSEQWGGSFQDDYLPEGTEPQVASNLITMQTHFGSHVSDDLTPGQVEAMFEERELPPLKPGLQLFRYVSGKTDQEDVPGQAMTEVTRRRDKEGRQRGGLLKLYGGPTDDFPLRSGARPQIQIDPNSFVLTFAQWPSKQSEWTFYIRLPGRSSAQWQSGQTCIAQPGALILAIPTGIDPSPHVTKPEYHKCYLDSIGLRMDIGAGSWIAGVAGVRSVIHKYARLYVVAEERVVAWGDFERKLTTSVNIFIFASKAFKRGIKLDERAQSDVKAAADAMTRALLPSHSTYNVRDDRIERLTNLIKKIDTIFPTYYQIQVKSPIIVGASSHTFSFGSDSSLSAVLGTLLETCTPLELALAPLLSTGKDLPLLLKAVLTEFLHESGLLTQVLSAIPIIELVCSKEALGLEAGKRHVYQSVLADCSNCGEFVQSTFNSIIPQVYASNMDETQMLQKVLLQSVNQWTSSSTLSSYRPPRDILTRIPVLEAPSGGLLFAQCSKYFWIDWTNVCPDLFTSAIVAVAQNSSSQRLYYPRDVAAIAVAPAIDQGFVRKVQSFVRDIEENSFSNGLRSLFREIWGPF